MKVRIDHVNPKTANSQLIELSFSDKFFERWRLFLESRPLPEHYCFGERHKWPSSVQEYLLLAQCFPLDPELLCFGATKEDLEAIRQLFLPEDLLEAEVSSVKIDAIKIVRKALDIKNFGYELLPLRVVYDDAWLEYLQTASG